MKKNCVPNTSIHRPNDWNYSVPNTSIHKSWNRITVYLIQVYTDQLIETTVYLIQVYTAVEKKLYLIQVYTDQLIETTVYLIQVYTKVEIE